MQLGYGSLGKPRSRREANWRFVARLLCGLISEVSGMKRRSDDWETPDELFALLSDRFGPFGLDVAASAENRKCPRYYGDGVDGLVEPWDAERVWLNPPYGRGVGKWLRKANQELEAEDGPACVVALLPVRTDSAWWHDYVMKYGRHILLVRGRVRFKTGHRPRFGSAVVVFEGPGHWLRAWGSLEVPASCRSGGR